MVGSLIPLHGVLLIVIPGRETFLISVAWENDWPVFNNGESIPISGKAPGLYRLEHDPRWQDDFSESADMQLGWYRKSTPQVIDWSLTERPGYLRLWGGPYNLSTPACTTMWLRKQNNRDVVFETKLDFRPSSPQTEAGVVVWWNYSCFSTLGIRLARDNHEKRAIVMSLADGIQTAVPMKSTSAEVVLAIRCGKKYEFGFKENSDADLQWVGSVSNQIMTRDPSVGAPFTGMMLGVYAFGDLEPVLVPTDFAYAKFERI